GFVVTKTKEFASRLVSELHGQSRPGYSTELKVERMTPRAAQDPSGSKTNLYITCLPAAYSQGEMNALFAPYGAIQASRLLSDASTGVSRGIGFVRYDSHAACVKAIEALNGTVPPKGNEALRVQFARDHNAGPDRDRDRDFYRDKERDSYRDR